MLRTKLLNFGMKLVGGARSNAPVLFAAGAVIGVGVTIVSTIQATNLAIEDLESECEEDECWQNWTPYEKWRIVWPRFIPVVLSGGLTIGMIIAGQYVSLKKAATLAALYTAAESKLSSYQESAKELLGEKKESEIRSNASQKVISEDPIGSKEVILTPRGNTLVYDAYSGRYFRSDIETIRQKVNDLNSDLYSTMWVALNDLYDAIGLRPIKIGYDVGWNPDHMIDVTFDACLAEDDTPCLVMDYLCGPRHDFKNLH